MLMLMSMVALISACGGGGGGGGDSAAPPADTNNTQQASAASVTRQLDIPDTLSSPPFDAGRTLTVPPGFDIQLWARVTGARFMALAPNGDVLVSVPSDGKIVLLRPDGTDYSGVPQAYEYATGLQNPHDMVFHDIAETTYLYVAESNRVTRSVYRTGETVSGERQTVVGDLPDDSTPGLQGNYGHQLKNIALSPDNKLYVSIASTCNACTADTVSDPVRAAIYQYNADGSDLQLFARGLRNAEGLDLIPGTGTLWVTVNNRDEISYPYNDDFDGDGASDQGRIIPAYVDENPAESFTVVRNGGHYGWPTCNPEPNPDMSNLNLAHDQEVNPNGSSVDCASADRAAKGIQAHSAPLGFSFLHTSNVPSAYRNGAVVALHGCWNCTSLRAGYKVVYFPFDDAGNAGADVDLVTGFVTDPDAGTFWGRPVDAIADGNSGILISDDFAGAIYRLYPLP
jgi:glucose/arabinose dehydrogenase